MTLEVPASADAVVIGAGIVGAAIAFELSKRGRHVIIVDAGTTAGGGSTGDSSAIIRLHYSSPSQVAAARDSQLDWLDWGRYLGEDPPAGRPRYVPTGALVLGGDPESMSSLQQRLGDVAVPADLLDADRIEGRFPALDASSFGPPAPVSDEEFFRGSRGRLTGLHYAESGYIDLPSLAAQNLVDAACRLGAGFVRRAQVVGIKTARSGVDGVRLADGTEISTPIAVNAAGPWSDRLNVVAGVAEEMVVRGRPLRTETHEIPAPAEFGNGVFVTDLDLGSAFRPQGASRVHISSIEPECDALEWLEAPDDCDRRPSDVIFQRQVLRVARRMPKLVVPNRPVGLGAVYDVTPDWTPIIDRTSLSGLYLACGTSGNSFKIAPFIGRALDALIVASESGQDHDRSPVQMPGRHLPVEFDLGAYSRLRRITSSRPRNVLG